MTRRPVKPKHIAWHRGSGIRDFENIGYFKDGLAYLANWPGVSVGIAECPFGRAGDRLWVRETWCPYDSDNLDKAAVVYRASYGDSREGTAEMQGAVKWFSVPHHLSMEFSHAVGAMEVYGERWKPSIHMPRWASRLTLEITDVRVQKLTEISEEDARAEGCEASEPAEWWQGYMDVDGELHHVESGGESPPDWMIEPKKVVYRGAYETAVKSFAATWDSLYFAKDLGWQSNPFVWAISFKTVA